MARTSTPRVGVRPRARVGARGGFHLPACRRGGLSAARQVACRLRGREPAGYVEGVRSALQRAHAIFPRSPGAHARVGHALVPVACTPIFYSKKMVLR